MKKRCLKSEQARPATLALVLLLSACASGPELPRPALPSSRGYAAPESVQIPTSAKVAAEAPDASTAEHPWAVFGNRALNDYIAQVLSQNPSLEAAEHGLAQAQALTAAQAAAAWPSVQASYSPTRTKLSGNQGGNSPGIQGDGRVISTQSGTPAAEGGQAPFNHPVIYNYHTAQLSVAYTLDVFKANEFQRQGLQAQAEASRWQRDAARAALVSQAIASAVQDALLAEQLRLLQAQIELQQRNTRQLREQLALGHASGQDLAQQLLQESQLALGLPALRRQRAQNRDAMRTLAGLPQDRPLPQFQLEDFQPSAPLRVPLPSRLLERRPDVLAAEAQLRAAEAAVGVAHAARLPQFSLSANWGGTAASPAQMLWQSGRFFDLTANLVAPLFDAGAGRRREEAAMAQWRQCAALYRAAVLQALQNVADGLQALSTDREAWQLAREVRQQADRGVRMADAQLAAGHIDRQAWSLAAQSHLQAQAQYAQAQAAWLADMAGLLQALGGAWPVEGQGELQAPPLAGAVSRE